MFLDSGKITKTESTSDGLRVWMTVSRVGELQYLKKDGSIKNVTVDAEELFNPESLNTAWGKPITHRHPPRHELPLTVDNIQRYQRGMTMQSMQIDEKFLTMVGVINDASLIQAIKGGEVEISAGYHADTIERNGRLYQTNRRYNHFSVVPMGRAGRDVKLHLDADDWVMDGGDAPSSPEQNRPNDKTMEITINSKTYTVDEEVGKAVVGQLNQLETTTRERDALSGQVAALTTQLGESKIQLDQAQTAPPSSEAIREYYQVRSIVEPALTTDEASFDPDYKMGIREMEVAYITQRFGEEKTKSLNLDAQSDDFINGLFLGLPHQTPTPPDTKPQTKRLTTDAALKILNGGGTDTSTGDGKPNTDAKETPRQRMANRIGSRAG